jgi:hypothetical protein
MSERLNLTILGFSVKSLLMPLNQLTQHIIRLFEDVPHLPHLQQGGREEPLSSGGLFGGDDGSLKNFIDKLEEM